MGSEPPLWYTPNTARLSYPLTSLSDSRDSSQPMQVQHPMGHWIRLCAARALEGCVCLHAWKGGYFHGYCTIVVCCELRMAPIACTAHMVVGTWLRGPAFFPYHAGS